jgi:di/tricarboxylate transporter
MTPDQAIAFAIVGGMLALFLWDRIRYDLVALLALLAAVLTGIVPTDQAFVGFASPVVIIIASVLVVSAAVANSGVTEILMRQLTPLMRSRDLQVGVLTALVAALSAFMKNIGALGLFLPIAVQTALRHKRSPSEFLMPLAFGSLVGGMATLIGTSPNLLISVVRREIVGAPFGMFDFTPVGLPIAGLAVAFLAFGWRLIPKGRKGQLAPEHQFRIETYRSEARLPEGSPWAGRTVAALEAIGEGDLTVAAIIREARRRYVPHGHWTLFAGDVLVLDADPQVLQRVIAEAQLELVGDEQIESVPHTIDQRGAVEAVVMAGSPMIDRSPAELQLRQRHAVNLLAVSRAGRLSQARLRHAKLQLGDVVVLQGALDAMPETLATLGALPLAERRLKLGRPRQMILPLAVLASAMACAALKLLPVEIAFLAAAVAVVLLKLVSLREAYAAVDWPIVILLGGIIPVGAALHHTGATDLIASGLHGIAAHIPPLGSLALVLTVAMLVTPLLHHAAAVLVMGPVAASLATQLGLAVDPFLMAVAVGASCDFLSPIGHQCNTLVMGPGGYRFSDYWHLGLPLSLLVVGCGSPLIALVWPLR